MAHVDGGIGRRSAEGHLRPCTFSFVRCVSMSDYLSNHGRTVIPTRTRDAGPGKPGATPDHGAGSTSVERSPAEVDALVARQRATRALPAFAVGAQARLISLGRELEDTSAARSERISRLSRRRLERHISARRQVEQL